VKRAALLVPALLAALLVIPAARAWACSCVGFSVEEAVERAGVLLRGTVMARQDPDGLGGLVNSSRTVTYEVDVAEIFKGSAAPTTYVRSAASGASCGLEVVTGREYVIFAAAQGSALTATLCGGTAPATAELVADVEAATGPGAPATEPPAPPPGATAPSAGGARLWLDLATGGVIVLLLAATTAAWVLSRRHSRGAPPAGS
jgi:hypothetical protein